MNKSSPLISALKITGIVMMSMGILIPIVLEAFEPSVLFPIGATFYFIGFYLRSRQELRESELRELKRKYPRPAPPAPMSSAGRYRGPSGSQGPKGEKGPMGYAVNRNDDTPYVPIADTSYLYQGADTTNDCSSSYDSGSSSNYDSSSSSDSGGSCGGSD